MASSYREDRERVCSTLVQLHVCICIPPLLCGSLHFPFHSLSSLQQANSRKWERKEGSLITGCQALHVPPLETSGLGASVGKGRGLLAFPGPPRAATIACHLEVLRVEAQSARPSLTLGWLQPWTGPACPKAGCSSWGLGPYPGGRWKRTCKSQRGFPGDLVFPG